jgi:predicted RNA-binding Zn-ribbon protein involved in translation (DUF1610 family)
MKNKFQCQSCSASLTSDHLESGMTTECPKCAAAIIIPQGGIKQGAYALHYVGILLVGGTVSALTGGLAYPLFLWWKIHVGLQRGMNIGLLTWQSVVASLIPFLGALYLCCASTGEATRSRAKKAKL